EVQIGGGDDPDIALERPGAGDTLELALLDDAQQLRLHRHRHLADLVEEDGAAVRQLEAPRLLAGGTGEGALLVAEELALDQRLGQRRAVEGDERPLAARRHRVDAARHQALAGAALAADEDRRAALCLSFDRLLELVDGAPLPEERAEMPRGEDLAAQRLVLLLELLAVRLELAV